MVRRLMRIESNALPALTPLPDFPTSRANPRMWETSERHRSRQENATAPKRLADLETGDSAAFARVSTRREGFDDGRIILVVVGPGGRTVFSGQHFRSRRGMRTNPFLDTWHFILGLTDVPYAEGAFKYAFAILFF